MFVDEDADYAREASCISKNAVTDYRRQASCIGETALTVHRIRI